MRVASVNQDPGISPKRAKGAAVHLEAMRAAFRQLGCEVETFDTSEPGALLEALENWSRGGDGLVYERYALGKDAAARFASRHDIPFVLEINAPLAQEAARYRDQAESPADREADQVVLGYADCVLAVSRQVAEYAQSRGARAERMMVRPNGIDTSRFNDRVDGSTVRDRYVPADAVVIGFHGRERPWHGFDNLAAAFRRLLEESVPAHLLVVGNGEFNALNGLPEGSYSRVGWQPHEEMPRFVAAFDVLPLTYDPGVPFYFSPLKLMEAMACGVVPIVPDMGDLPLLVEHEVNGLVYPAGDARALDEALLRLAGENTLRSRLASRAAQDAKLHTWIDIARSVLERVDPGSGENKGARS